MSSKNLKELYERIKVDITYLHHISPAYIQRVYKVKYSTAAIIIKLLAFNSLIGPADGAKPREVLKKGQWQ